MGKKSRRQREKDPVNEMVKYQARQTGEGKQQALRRMKEALNSMHPRSAPSVAPAPNVARDDDDDDEPAPALSGVDNAKIILVQVLGGIGRQDVLDANLEKQLRLLTDDAALAYAQYVRGQDPRALWGLGPGLQAWLLEGISNGAKREDDDDSELDAVQDAAPAASKPTVAEAEAEYRAATTPDGFTQERGWDATMYLRDALTIDEDDQNNFDAYIGIVSPRLCVTGESELVSMKILKAMKRWPRYRKYWPRIRRRLCWGCGKQYDLSEPRLWVCTGCGEARYCNAACQSAHWPAHKTPCLKTFHKKTKKSLSRGVSVQKLRQAYLEAYHDDGAARVFSAMDKK